MATTTTAAVVQAPSAASPPAADFTATNLSRLLSRLEAILLDSSPSNTQLRLLRKSQYDRTRVGANLDHARTLLFRLEHSSPAASSTALPSLARGPKATPAAADRTADIQRKRTQLRRLQAALDELHTLPSDERDDGTDIAQLLGADPHEDLAARYAGALVAKSTPAPARPTASDAPVATTRAAPATQPNTLRARKPGAPEPTTSATHASGAAHMQRAPAQSTTPFAPKPKDAAAPDRSTAQLLEAHSGEQDALTEGLVALASALRASTAAFGASLESANPLVDAAAAALERNVSGLEAAGRRMGALRRVAEGKGWLARLGLYGWIAALWVALVLLVFVLPKLRLR